VTRTDDAGRLRAGVFLVDLWCLGVKDAFLAEMPASEWPRNLSGIIPDDQRVALHPACARKLVEGAAAYAESLGFAPHRDYNASRRVFGSVKAADCPEILTFGREGKPFYLAGPDDDHERIERVLRTLTAKLGADGFHYVVPVHPDAADWSTEETLRDLLCDCPTGTPSFEMLSGFLTALNVCPTEVPAEAVKREIWAGEPPRFAGARVALEAEKCIHAYRQEIGADLTAAREADGLARALNFEVEVDYNDISGASEWCRGFLRPLELWPDAWRGAGERADLQGCFALLRAIAADGDPDGGDIPFPTAALRDEVGGVVLALRDALRPPPAGRSSPG